jgi:hypothetical protein
MYRKWYVAIAREEFMVKILTVQKYYRVCDIHFDEQMNNPNLQIVPTDHYPSPDLSIAV